MAIIKTIAEIKQLMPRLLSALSNNALLPNVDRATDKYLRPLIGDALFDQVHDKYVAGTDLTADETTLLPKMQLVVAAHAFLDELAFTHASITDHGVRTATTANMPRVYGWEFKELKDALELAALDSVDVLLKHLVTNQAKFGAWTGSPEFAEFNQLLIKTAMEFDVIHRLQQPFRTFYSLKTVMVDVQDQHIIESIGQALFDYFNTTQDLTLHEKGIKKQLQKAIAFLTIRRACEHYAVQMDHHGFTIVAAQGDAESTAAGRTGNVGSFLTMKMDACEKDGKNYLAKARNYMVSYYGTEDATPAFKTAFEQSDLVNYIQPTDRNTGNDRRHIFRF